MAMLEVFVHLGRVKPSNYVIRKATIPDGVTILFPEEHPAKLDGFHWALTDETISRRIGSQWLAGRETAVLVVPSAVVKGEYNFLLNPTHQEFSKIVLSDPEPYEFDERLWKAAMGPA
jgi:RES domain-containing protein